MKNEKINEIIYGYEKQTFFLPIVFFVILGFVSAARAQYGDYYYHRVGDTIEWQAENGYYSWWEWKPFYENNLSIIVGLSGASPDLVEWSGSSFEDSAVLLQRFYTPAPLKIIGVAGACVSGVFSGTYLEYLDSSTFHNYLLIYDAQPNNFQLVASAEWSAFDPHRTLHIKTHAPLSNSMEQDSCCKYNPTEEFISLYEYYFDSAIYVEDSFYVGGTFFYQHTGGMTRFGIKYRCAWTPANYRLTNICSPDLQSPHPPIFLCAFVNPMLVKYKKGVHTGWEIIPYHNAQWRWKELYNQASMIYPIIEVDTTVLPRWACDSVANVQAVTEGTSATVTWDDSPNYTSVTLIYGLCAEPQSQWRTVDVTGSTLYSLTGLQPSACYGVRIKAECDSCKKDTPWSPEVRFYTGVDTAGGGNVDTTGVVGGTLLAQYTYVVPNPARDEVRVTSSFSLREIEIWTVDGVQVYSGGAVGHEVTVDVSWLRAGTYVMAVRTHAGTTHKRLVVAR